ncbi:hypothetical protein A1Q2_05991 [Trichosporon asahii var. asahii CBS 8904]|uniref:Uncharacterized protein n=1 Tax=Trichosporon asahii var. asahii (strain CBS 8904) TaxID=1220162 RepID=K1VKG4_TRIAC|nr:hypothetical protein A1Q2_05991 [Trichosporon asahii var. asahii CBS 8904]
MKPDHVIVSSRAVQRAIKSDVYRSTHKLGFEADDFLAKLFDFAEHTCITWPSDKAPTPKQLFRFVRRSEGIDNKVIKRIRKSADFDSHMARSLRLRGSATFHGLDSVSESCLYSPEGSKKRYFSRSQCKFGDVRMEGQSLILNLNDTAPDQPLPPHEYDTFEFISTGDIDLTALRKEVKPYTTGPHCLFMSAYYDNIIATAANYRLRARVTAAVEKLRRSRDVLEAYLDNRSSATPTDTRDAANADETYKWARITLRELEEYPGAHEDLFEDKLYDLFEEETANFPLTSERLKITALEDAEPCSACGRKDFEEEETLSSLIAATQSLPLMTTRMKC